jgi:hypothetical protein
MLLGGGLVGLSVLALWLLFRRKVTPAVDLTALLESEKVRLAAERDAEAKARLAAEKVAKDLELEVRAIANWKKQRMEVLDEEKAQKYRDMAGDPDAILRRLDEILGGPKRDDPTDPG